MHSLGIADPDQLAILTKAVDEHCREAGIDPTSEERDAIAGLVMTLFSNGKSTAAELRSALLARSARKSRRYG